MTTGAPFIPAQFATTNVTPSVATAPRSLPYVSPSDFRYAPTAVGTMRLVTGSAEVSQDALASLSFVLDRASSWVDEICFRGKAGGYFQAHQVIESQWVAIKPAGDFALICNFKPVLEVTGLALGPMPSQLTNLASPASQDIYIEGKIIHVPAAWSTTPLPLYAYPADTVNKIYVVWSYVCGWPNMALVGPSGSPGTIAAGATTLTLTPPPGSTNLPGVYANSYLKILDGPNTETVQVLSSPVSNIVTLVAATKFTHTVPALPDFVRVTQMPSSIDEATILLGSVLLKVQGSRAMVLQGAAGTPPTQQAIGMAGASDDYAKARELLKRHEVVFLHD